MLFKLILLLTLQVNIALADGNAGSSGVFATGMQRSVEIVTDKHGNQQVVFRGPRFYVVKAEIERLIREQKIKDIKKKNLVVNYADQQ